MSTSTSEVGATRIAVVAAATALIEAGGVEALSVRRLAAEADTSTMSVYTHFGSVAAVIGEVVDRGFDCLAEHVDAVGCSGDPLIDQFCAALAYLEFAKNRPHLYATMFRSLSIAARMPSVLDGQWRSAVHGVAMLRIAGHGCDDGVVRSLLTALAVGNGVDRAVAEEAFTAATSQPEQPER